MITNCLDIDHNSWEDSPLTMINGDIITISGVDTGGGNKQCSTDANGAQTVNLLELSANKIFIPSNSFSKGCSRQNITLNWNGADYSLTSVDFVNGGSYDEIVLNNDVDMQQFIGRQVHSSGTENLAGKATIQTDNDGVILSVATSAQNCHRYVDWNDDGDTNDAGDQKGWNTVTPW